VCGADDRQRAARRLRDQLDAERFDIARARHLAGLDQRLEPGRVREAAGRKCRVSELEHEPCPHQNSE
jgi:hypothetical protein